MRRARKKKAKHCELRTNTNYSRLIPTARLLSCLIHVYIYEDSVGLSRDTAEFLSKLSNDTSEYKVGHWRELNSLNSIGMGNRGRLKGCI